MYTLNVASISAEVDPYSKSGGLADVARSLPKALKRQGHNVIIVTPFYGDIIDVKKYNLKKIEENVTIIIDNNQKNNDGHLKFKVNFWQGELMENLPIYFIENEKYFSKRKELYGSSHENARFILFDMAVLELLIKLKFQADIIHCHDWHSGLIPYFLKHNFKDSEIFKNTATVFTIHNLTFQLGHDWWQIPEDQKDNGRNGLPNFNDPKIETINFVKRAILNADVVNTVSENYAKEIMTKDFGQDLHRILKNRKDRIFGIVNGIDYKDYNPHNDPGLYRNFDWHNFKVKKKNKLFIQKYYGLPQNEKTPLLCMTSRIAEQKGFDLIRDISDIIFRFDLQMIIMGDGDEKIIKHLKKLQKENPKELVHIFYQGACNEKMIENFKKSHPKENDIFYRNESKMETSLYAGADFILIPSRFEPCGLTQMKSMRYGCVPIAHYVGGYIDTVYNYNSENRTGNGFVFTLYDSRSMVVAITRALETYKRKDERDYLVEKVMRQSFSWEYPARKYIELFNTALKIKNS